ncbi:MAG: hypothetical protein J1E60_08290 [Christensenellaceae bacterium]|nr:hypothetical protein [Christensenellaceae bacterium]
MNDELKQSYKRSFYGGRTIFSRISDTVLFGLLLFATFYLVSAARIGSRPICTFLSIILAIIGLLISDIIVKNRFEKHKILLREQLKSELARQKLLLIDLNELRPVLESAFGKPVWVEQSTSSIAPDTIYSVARYMKANGIKSCMIVSIATLSEEAVKCLEALPVYNIEHRLVEDIPEISSGINVTEDEIDAAVLRKFKKHTKRHPSLSLAIAPDRIKKYFTMGLLISILSFVMPYGIYMRVIASLAFSAAGGLFLREEIKHRNDRRKVGN